MNRSRRILLGGTGLAAALLLGGGWLVGQALHGASASRAERHQEVAARLFDELERELTALVQREEARSFLEYRFYYVPEDNAFANPTIAQSPLSRPPDDPAIVGWFQLDPGGELQTPFEPRGNEQDLAEKQGWTGRDWNEDQVAEINAVVDRVSTWWTPPPPERAVAEVGNVGNAELFLNRGVQQRSARTTQKLLTKQANFSAYRGDALEEVAAQQQDGAEGAEVDVDVAPMTGARIGEYFVLSRIVRSEGIEHRQGVVLRVAELVQGLERTVLDGSPLRPYVALAWDGAPEDPRTYRAAHRFAEPFAALAVAASLDAVPELVGSEALTIRLLALALALAVLGGGLGLGRAIWTELEFARRRSDFVAAVSHELKTPLTTIRMYAEMLRDGMVPTSERQREYHATITAESDRLGRLIDNVLELARLERGGPTRAQAPVVGEVAPIVREAMEIVRPLAEKAGFALELDAAPGLPPARVDRDALVQVVVNLVDNAVKFAAEGERTIRLELGGTSDGRVELVVRDHGPGVPSGQQAKVFEPFYRGERELTRKTRGTGIGLALVRGLVERMGGEVAARNHPDGGFEVTLRLAPV